MNSNPLVSVVIPTYNRAHLIEESIKSVLEQTFEDWELIIVDDGSEDNTEHIIQKIKNSKIRYYKSEHCGLLGKVRNYGIKMAQGKYIAFLDSDDLWRKDKIALQLEFFDKYDIHFTFSNGSHFGDSVAIQPPSVGKPFIGDLFLPLIFEHRFVIYMPSFLVKKEVFSTIEMFNETFRSGADVDFAYRMALKFRGAFSDERLVAIRKHDFGMSLKYREVAFLEDLQIQKNFFNQNVLSKKQYKNLTSTTYYKLALLNLKNDKHHRAFEYFLEYNKLRPFSLRGWIRLLQVSLEKLFSKTATTSRTGRK